VVNEKTDFGRTSECLTLVDYIFKSHSYLITVLLDFDLLRFIK